MVDGYTGREGKGNTLGPGWFKLSLDVSTLNVRETHWYTPHKDEPMCGHEVARRKGNVLTRAWMVKPRDDECVICWHKARNATIAQQEGATSSSRPSSS
jgi:hypothetical protein